MIVKENPRKHKVADIVRVAHGIISIDSPKARIVPPTQSKFHLILEFFIILFLLLSIEPLNIHYFTERLSKKVRKGGEVAGQ